MEFEEPSERENARNDTRTTVPTVQTKSTPPRVEKPATKRMVVLEDVSDEEDETPVTPFEKLVPKSKPRSTTGILRNAQSESVQEKAYKLVPKYDDPNIITDLVDQTKMMELRGITVEKLAAMSGDYAKRLRNITFKTRRPIKPVMMLNPLENASTFPFMEDDDIPVHLSTDALELESLPPVDSFYVSTEEDTGTKPGCLVCTDVVLTYLSTLTGLPSIDNIFTFLSIFFFHQILI